MRDSCRMALGQQTLIIVLIGMLGACAGTLVEGTPA